MENAVATIERTSSTIVKIMEDQDFVVCPHVIFGAGDTGTTIWLEKYRAFHSDTQKKLNQGQLPEVLMIGEVFGSWKHDYTLAQPHNLLERCGTTSNPSDYVSEKYYGINPYANARHIYQSNRVNLAETNAPLLMGTKIIGIEKQSEHISDWKCTDQAYRLIVITPKGKKTIYTNEIDICTGLGPAKNALANTVIDQEEFTRLNQFDPKKKFTPIVDGNQFILSDSEEHSPDHRKIVVYGGGGYWRGLLSKRIFWP